MDLDQWIISSEKPPPEKIIAIQNVPEETGGFKFTPLTIVAIIALSLLVIVILLAVAHSQMGSSSNSTEQAT